MNFADSCEQRKLVVDQEDLTKFGVCKTGCMVTMLRQRVLLAHIAVSVSNNFGLKRLKKDISGTSFCDIFPQSSVESELNNLTWKGNEGMCFVCT